MSAAELLGGGSWNQQLTIDAGQRFVTAGVVHCNAITSGFFDTLGVPLVAGRDFDSREDSGSTGAEPGQVGDGLLKFRAAIVNESLARRYFGNRNPIGARLGLGNEPGTKTKSRSSVSFARSATAAFVRPTIRRSSRSSSFRSRAGPSGFDQGRVTVSFASIRTAVHTLDPGLSIVTMRTLDHQLDRALFNERLLAMLASGFAGLAVLLAVVGVYGVMSFVVSHRTREIGIRVALGASRGSAIWLILRDATTMLGRGVLMALPAVAILGRLIESQLFGVQPVDWPTILAAAVIVSIATIAASALPVVRATAISPIEALRNE